ncbi:MAG TPA: ankyrin repeat domain-containing protein [Opitutaceae bacterium]|nr:ankyrin repeat domain-containing protein [Opitutaceae bacterium]
MKQLNPDILHQLVHNGDLSGVRRLLTEARPAFTRRELRNSLIAAALGTRENDAAIIRLLLEHGADPEEHYMIGPVLLCAAMNGALQTVKVLIEFGADPNRLHKKETALSAALSENQTATIHFLEEIGALVDPSLELLYAAKFGDLKRAHKALAAGADVNIRGGDPVSQTPIEMASWKGHREMVKLLLGEGAGKRRRRDLHEALNSAAARAKDPLLVELLVKAGASPDARVFGETALMVAAGKGDVATARMLIQLGADTGARNEERGMTVLDYARQGKNKGLCALVAGTGAGSERDSRRLMVRRLAREFGGRVIEHSTGYLLNTKFCGHRSQVSVDRDDASIAVFGLRFVDSALRNGSIPDLLIGEGEPSTPVARGRLRRIPAASEAAGIKVCGFTSPDRKQLGEIVALCRRIKPTLLGLLKKEGEFLRTSKGAAVFIWKGSDVEGTIDRLKVFGGLIGDLARPPTPERRLFECEWLIKPAPKSSGASAFRHVFGGSDEPPAACPSCAAAANPIIRIDLSDARLPATALGRVPLPVRWCLDCAEWSATFYPLSKQPKKRAAKVAASAEPALPESAMTLVHVAPPKKAGRKSKLGGSPSWIQMDDTPDCRSCGEPMAFVLQMNSDARISYGDVGMLYAFVCPDCRLIATVVQSH